MEKDDLLIDPVNDNTEFIDEIEYSSVNPDLKSHRGIVHEKNGSSIAIKEDGDIDLASNPRTQIKMKNGESGITFISEKNKIISNRVSLDIDELEINDHKFNKRLWELADHRIPLNDDRYSMGNYNTSGYVLMKHWEESLGKWVLIRRQIRMPLFYPETTLPDVPKQLAMEAEISKEDKEKLENSKLGDFFGLSENDPAYQEAESQEPINEDQHILESQILDPRDDIIIDMGPIKSNVGSSYASSGFSAGGPSGDLNIDIPGSNGTASGHKDIPKVLPGVKVYDLNKQKNIQLSPNLKVSDFRCSDGNPIVLVCPVLVQKLEELFRAVNSTNFRITSGFRTYSRNAKVGGVANSQHLFGKAVDIAFSDVSVARVYNAVKKIGVGYTYKKESRGFCHLDTRGM